jgi:hypothetical protein
MPLVFFAIGIGVAYLVHVRRNAPPPRSSSLPPAEQAERSGVAEQEAPHGRSSPNPPRFVGSNPAVQNDPTAPDYDAVKLLDLTNRAQDVYRAEPRDPLWAPQMEATLREKIVTEIGERAKHAEILSLECHTSTCRAVLDAGDDDTKRNQTMIALQEPPLASRTAFVADETAEGKTTVIFAVKPKYRSPAAYAEKYERDRKATLDRLRRVGAPRMYFPAGTFDIEKR